MRFVQIVNDIYPPFFIETTLNPLPVRVFIMLDIAFLSLSRLILCYLNIYYCFVGVIHGDYNEQNIIVTQEENVSESKIIGLIDFGDMSHSCYVFEAAITIMYMMVESRIVDPLDVGGYVLAGKSYTILQTYLNVTQYMKCEDII